jgi:hypothetical protein
VLGSTNAGGVVPLALIAGAVRGIPFYWRLIACAFGVGGAALLWPCRSAIGELERLALSTTPDAEAARTASRGRRVASLGLVALTLAADGTGCDVSPDRFRDTKEGDLVSCPDWRAEPPR